MKSFLWTLLAGLVMLILFSVWGLVLEFLQGPSGLWGIVGVIFVLAIIYVFSDKNKMK